ncbi:MAG: ABC transporter permease [Rhodobacteraceae bacterium]|jgi:putative ABC transport system permease protein|nr:ABC transporter permease [Paracoccaceae bacterium]
MLRAGLAALAGHWRRHPLQLAMALAGLALATALWTGVQAINVEARSSYARAAALLAQDRLARLVPLVGARLDEADFVALRRAGWLVAPVIEGWMPAGAARLRLVGIDPLTAPPGALALPAGEAGGLAGFITPPGRFLADAATAPAAAAHLPGPVAAAEGVAPGVVVGDVGIVQGLLDAEGQLSRLLLWPEQPAGLPAWQAVAPGLRLETPAAAGDLARLTDSFHLNLTAFGLFAYVVGLFIVHAAVGLAFEQRRATFRTLRALGMPVATLVALSLAELLAMALAAGLAGVALGYLLAGALLPDVAATLRGLYGAAVAGGLALRAEWWAAGLAMAVAGTLVAAAAGLVRLARLPVLSAARPRAWARASARLIGGQAAAGAGLLALALGAGALPGLPAAFAAVAALLLGAALVLPGVLAAALAAVAPTARGPVAGWFLADTRLQLPGLSLALMALMLALAANIGVGTMVSSFRLAFTAWLDQRLVSELYVTARDDAEAAEVREWLAPQVDAVLPIWSVEGPLAGLPGEIYGVADHATYRDHWPLIAAMQGAWDRVAAGRAVMASEQLARRAGLAPGDALVLPGGVRVEVAGVYADYGNPVGQVLLAADRLAELYPQVERRRWAVRVAPAKAAELAAGLAERFGLEEGAVVDRAAVKALSLGLFERTFAVTAALNVLTLGVAGVALLASLVTLAGMRLPQLAPVWALGLTRARLARLELARALMLAALVFAAALPLGLALAWLLLARVNVEAFGWRLPMHLFPADWGVLLAMALAAAGLAAAGPARRLARLRPAELLGVFANER